MKAILFVSAMILLSGFSTVSPVYARSCNEADYSAPHGSIYTAVIDSATGKSYPIVGLKFWETNASGKMHLWVGIIINESQQWNVPRGGCIVMGNGLTNNVRWTVNDNSTGLRCDTYAESGFSNDTTLLHQFVVCA